MTLHEEMLKRQNEGYHTPLSEVIERIEKSHQKLKPTYAELDIVDAVFYLRQYLMIIEKVIENSHKKAMDIFINGEECPKRN